MALIALFEKDPDVIAHYGLIKCPTKIYPLHYYWGRKNLRYRPICSYYTCCHTAITIGDLCLSCIRMGRFPGVINSVIEAARHCEIHVMTPNEFLAVYLRTDTSILFTPGQIDNYIATSIIDGDEWV